MNNYRLKNLLRICTLFAIGLLSRTNAKAQGTPMNTYYETREHCKFIKNNSQVVINHHDTLPVYNIDTIYERYQKKVICDLGPDKAKLIFDPLYYENTPWLPPVYNGDTIAYKMIRNDAILVNLYYSYEKLGDYKSRDSIEKLIEANRCLLWERAKRDFNKQY